MAKPIVMARTRVSVCGMRESSCVSCIAQVFRCRRCFGIRSEREPLSCPAAGCGAAFLPAKRLQPARFSWRRAQKILDQIEPLLQAVHAAGWVWRDCKPSHIFVDRAAVRLIDFEIACRIGDRRASPWGSTDYLPPGQREKSRRCPGTLEDDYALGVIAFQFMCGQFPPRGARKRASFYRRAGCPASLRSRIENLLGY